MLELCYQEKFRQICALATVPFFAAILIACGGTSATISCSVLSMTVAQNNYLSTTADATIESYEYKHRDEQQGKLMLMN